MDIDYSPFLRPAEDGRIWWRLEDAIKLGAGYLPLRDDDCNLVPVLRAPNNRVLADERTLMGGVHDPEIVDVLPRILDRDGVRLVEANDFLNWLAQYLTKTQDKIPFPDDLVRAVKGFESLTAALEDWFDRPLAELPDALRQRVERDFFPMPWDRSSPEQRHSVAQQWDYQNDPAMQGERTFCWDFFVRKGEIEKEVETWEAVASPTAGDLAKKEAQLREHRQELARMEQQQRQARGDYYPERKRLDGEDGASSAMPDSPVRYVPYPKAMKSLAARLNASPEELAAWVWMGPKDGGLAAYLNANELDPPPRFNYYNYNLGDDFDYLSPLMACWFREDDIANFAPADRFITGKALIERWSNQPSILPEAFILAKIRESRLYDMHPITGLTQGSIPEDASSPTLTSALFSLSEIWQIESEDLGVETTPGTCRSSTGPVVGSPEWRRLTATAAANAKHEKQGGSREKQKKIRELWASGKYTTRDRCAEEECAALGMSFAAARRALRNTPAP